MGGRWLRAVLRLSIVVAAVMAAVESMRHFGEIERERARNTEQRLGYECAAKFRDEDLLRARNDFGNINVGIKPFHCANRDFWVAMHEIEDVRKGAMNFSTSRSYFDWQRTVGSLAFGFVATNLLGLLIAGVVMLARWIAKPLSG